MSQALVIPVTPDVMEERQQRAYSAGREAQAAGAQQVPAQDAHCMALLQGLAVGQGLPVLDAWQQGYRHNQDEQQIREFAQQLGQQDEIEAQLVGLTNETRIRLWWELFHQLPDGH